MKRLILMISIFSLSLQGAELAFQKGNEALDQGNYQQAIVEYETALKESGPSAALHYNLGFAYYRIDQLGKALFHFRYAHRLNPRDADTKFNLEYARKSSSDSVDGEGSFSWKEFFAAFPLSKKESAYALSVAFFFWGVSAAILVFWRREWLLMLSRAILFLNAILLTGFTYKAISEKPFGVVTAKQADVYSGKGVGSVLLFSLHEGTEFDVQDVQGEWLQIVLADGKMGWLLGKDCVSL